MSRGAANAARERDATLAGGDGAEHRRRTRALSGVTIRAGTGAHEVAPPARDGPEHRAWSIALHSPPPGYSTASSTSCPLVELEAAVQRHLEPQAQVRRRELLLNPTFRNRG